MYVSFIAEKETYSIGVRNNGRVSYGAIIRFVISKGFLCLLLISSTYVTCIFVSSCFYMCVFVQIVSASVCDLTIVYRGTRVNKGINLYGWANWLKHKVFYFERNSVLGFFYHWEQALIRQRYLLTQIVVIAQGTHYLASHTVITNMTLLLMSLLCV